LNQIRFSLLSAICVLAAGMTGTAGASQIAQFIQFNQNSSIFSFTDVGGTSDSFSATGQIEFTFANGLGTPFDGVERLANFTFTATSSTPGTTAAGSDNEGGFSGSFSIIDAALLTNLLSGTFGSSAFANGSDGGTSAAFQDSTPPSSEVSFTSDYLNFALSTTQAFSISLSSIAPEFTLGTGDFINDSGAVGSGTFSAVPPPTSNSPEPATATMIGLALTGVGLFLRKKLVS
jgi:hypothetical protein